MCGGHGSGGTSDPKKLFLELSGLDLGRQQNQRLTD